MTTQALFYALLVALVLSSLAVVAIDQLAARRRPDVPR